jgi:sulfite reductase (ferredoxin)
MEPKKLSPNETLKENSNYLRGTIKESLAAETTHFSKDEANLLKHHGTYEQDDRDIRQQLLKEKKEPAYSMMVRCKLPGGKLSASQYLILNDLADKYGNKTLRITTRQGFQFHGVLKKNLKAAIRTMNEALITTLGACGDNVRNVLGCPAPFTDRLKMKVYEYAKQVSDLFLWKSGAYHEIWLNGEQVSSFANNTASNGNDPVEPIYGKTYLPRKFKIAIAFPDDNCIDVYANDLGIVPEIQNGELKGFNLLVGGGFGMTHGVKTTYPRLASPLCFVKPEDLLEASKAIVLVQRDFGNRTDRKRARLKYTIDERGLPWFRSEMEKRFGKKTEDPHPIHWKEMENHLGWFPAGDGKWFLGLPVENGRVKDESTFRLKSGLKALAQKYQPVIYLTAQQDIILSGFEESQKSEIEQFLISYGVKPPSQVSHLRKDAIACPALPTCGLAITESERALPAVVDEIEKKIESLGLSDQRIMMRMTGCPNGCARPYNAEIAFVGKMVGFYNVYVGGNLEGTRLNVTYAEKVAQKDLASTVTPLLTLYKKERQTGEAFGDFCFRLGVERLKAGVTALQTA